MFNSFRDKDMDTCTLWVKESPPGSLSGLFRFRRWLFPALMVAMVFVLILVLGVTNTKTSSRLWTAEEDMSILADRMKSLNASLQQSHESIKDVQHLQSSIQDNKDQLVSVSAALQQLAVLDSLNRAVEGLKCSLERIVRNSSATGPCCPMDWTRLGSDCYFFSQQHLNWNQSKSWCERNRAHLVILNSDQEWDFVTKTSVPNRFWVGLTDGRTGRWEWVNQTPYTIERRRWCPGQPDAWTGHGMGPGDEDCAHLHSNGRLNDVHCSTTMRFICQRRSTNI